MKTTIDIDTPLLKKAKKAAALSGMSLRAFVEDALRVRLLSQTGKKGVYRLDMPTVRGKVSPSVDMDSRQSLYDYMDDL